MGTMKSESPIGENFFHSSQFCELLKDARKSQLKDIKGRIDDLNSPENPLMKEIFGDKTYEKIRANNIERSYKKFKKA